MEIVENRKRKNISDIFDLEENSNMEIVRAIQASPSGINLQPWYVKVNNNTWHFFKKKSSPLIPSAVTSFNNLDIGIAICHGTLAAKELNYKVEHKLLDEEKKGYEYILSLELS